MLDQDLRANRLRPIDRLLADELLRRWPSAHGRCGELAALASLAVAEGHSCLDLAGLAAGDLAALGSWGAVGEPGSATPLILEERTRLYLRRYWRYEDGLARAIKHRIACNPQPAGVDDADLLASLFRERNEQMQAAHHVLHHGLTVLMGGPGTGKTWTLLRILIYLLRTNAAMAPALVAPTGKAAARINEMLATIGDSLPSGDCIKALLPNKAQTIHALLGLYPGRSKALYRPERLLEVDLLVVDEAAMVPLPIMAKLFDAVPPSARIVLVGDAGQLAPVEAGSVLADFRQAASHDPDSALARSCVILQKRHRFAEAGGLGEALGMVETGNADALIARLSSGSHGIAWHNAAIGPSLANELALAKMPCRPGTVAEALAGLDKVRILVGLREGPFGVAGCNQVLLRHLRARHGEKTFMHGLPLMLLQAAPRWGLHNGDTGVLWFAQGGYRAFFRRDDGEIAECAEHELPERQIAWATTVHKAQGSEFEHVVILLPDPPHPLITRQWLYTAMSRAKRGIDLVASELAIRAAMENRSQRCSGLAQKLI